jgi:hypothetical protein
MGALGSRIGTRIAKKSAGCDRALARLPGGLETTV